MKSCQRVRNFIRLTPKASSQIGAVWFKKPVPIGKGFQTIFKFQVTDPGADGFAFVLQNKGDSALGGDGCQIGLFFFVSLFKKLKFFFEGYGGIPCSVAVEFDTYQSFDRTLDPNGNHISIHTCGTAPNSAHHDYSLGCTTSFGGVINDGKIHTCKITYASKQLRFFSK